MSALLDELQGFTDGYGGRIPAHMWEGLFNYIEHHRKSGSFLMAILKNDLTRAVQTADPMNVKSFRPYIYFLMEHAPDQCWGSSKKVDKWLKNEKKN